MSSRSPSPHSRQDREKERDRHHDRRSGRSRKYSRNRSRSRTRSRSRSHDRHHSRRKPPRRSGSHDRSDSDSRISRRTARSDDRDRSLNEHEREKCDHHDDSDRGKRSNRDDDRDDWNFDFSQHRSSLNRLFFSKEEDIIQRNSRECDDFWEFLKRFQTMKRKKAESSTASSQSPETYGKFNLPLPYDTKHRISIQISNKEVDYYIERQKSLDGVNYKRIRQFRDIIHYYLDFCQKQKFAKLQKIKNDQKNLPIFSHRAKILETVGDHQVVVIAADTGAGKSTQLPQYLMEEGYENIACTQPRRIACVSLSKRVAHETLNEYGSKVGYQVRFDKSKTSATKILFLTEGLLLRQLSVDQLLPQYNVIVIDEVHERHVHTDFLLGVVKCLVRHRQDLKVILMSATINIKLFSEFFDNCPVVQVPGRLYPIQLEYCPISREEETGKTEKLNPRPYIRIMQRIDHKYPESERGDLLIFSSGMSEIMAIAEAARGYASKTKRWIVLPLHSTLSSEDQDKVFDIAPEGVRKCIIATNIAETSITIDGVRFIIDSGKVKEISHDPVTKMQRLREFPISRASAEQRKGRAGRTGPGVCFRLYEENTYSEFQDYSTPEIQRVSLVSIILQMLSMGLPDARRFPFVEPPSDENLENAILALKEQGALTNDEELTPIGHMLATLPVDVTIGKMLILGSMYHMIAPVLTVAAAMSVQSPYTHKAHSDHDAQVSRRSLESDHGDPITLMNIFNAWISAKSDGSNSRKWCKRRGLEEQRLYEIVKLRRQFEEMMTDQNLMQAKDKEDETSDQRRQKSGQRRKLGQLKRHQNKQSKKPKVLRMEDDLFIISSGDEADDKDDIRDLELRLTQSLDQLQQMSGDSDSYSGRDLSLLKLILCSGLYPQVAIADETNSYRKDSELIFHTRDKQFVLLHPTSCFQNHVDVLAPKCSDRESASERRYKFSTRHELLTYVSLLETNKPYLITTMRVPAMQTLLLFSRSLDTTSDLSRILCDGWLELEFKKSEEAEEVVSNAVYLRSSWHSLLSLRLKQKDRSSVDEVANRKRELLLERILTQKLSEYLANRVEYSIRRVLAAELKTCYAGASDCGDDKGGMVLTEYLRYDCLVSEGLSVEGEYAALMPRSWACPQCGEELTVTTAMRIQHQAQCDGTAREDQLETEQERARRQAVLNPMRKLYHCDHCNQDLALTATEILKHKKSHAKSSE